MREQLQRELQSVRGQLAPLAGHALAPDVELFAKAVELALRHGEFYRLPQDANRALDVLRGEAQRRVQELARGSHDWTRQRGRVVRGYRSRIDDSVQPYGLVIPDDVNFDRPVPLYVWLHGRGDTQTDLHFVAERLARDGQIKPAGAIVLHPFGRHCVGFKSAGEIDVLEAIEHVQSQYAIDPERVVLIGFSMGGAGAWHVGAHYTDHFVAISPGAGFAETARYTHLQPANYPPRYEQQLWGVYDVPNYVRNLFNRTVVAYSGELDKQIQAARVMEEAYQEHGRQLPHRIGPGMGHKYHPDTLRQLLEELAQAVKAGRPAQPQHVSLQTRTLRYPQMDWVRILRLEQHWNDSRVDAEIMGERALRVTTQNVTALQLTPQASLAGAQLKIDGQTLAVPENTTPGPLVLVKAEAWRLARPGELEQGLAKRPGLQGPIDDVFLEPFLVVTPTGRSNHARVQSWVDSELAHFQDRWRALFRGELRMKPDDQVTDEDLRRYHIVVWGTPASNRLLHRIFADHANDLPFQWSDAHVQAGQRRWPTDSHVPAFIYPNPLQPSRYVVVNSGPTFREAHDRTNSLQNPKLPDWAVIDLSQPPSAEAPGAIAAADFFDESWQVR